MERAEIMSQILAILEDVAENRAGGCQREQLF